MVDRYAGRASGFIAVGEVMDVNDPWQHGAVKVQWKIGSAAQNELGLDDLPWTKAMFPSTNPSLGQVGGPHTGLRKGSTVIGIPMGGDGQDFLIIGSLVSTGNGQPDQTQTPDSDIARAAKQSKNDDVSQPRYGDVNDVALKWDTQDVVRTSIIAFARDEAGPDHKPADYPDLTDSIGVLPKIA